jgi:hypothetical protein
MSTGQEKLLAMMAQYEKNNSPKFEKKEAKVYDLNNYFTTYLPKGTNSATKQIRIIPTESGSPFQDFFGHKVQVDGEWKTFACLKTENNEACPFCEAREALIATGKDSDREYAKKYNQKQMYIVKVIDRENEGDGVKFWRFNHSYSKDGVYDKVIGILNAIKKDITDEETGRDLLLTITRNSRDIAIVSGIATLDPSPLTSDPALKELWVNDTRTWRDVYAERNYEYLEIIVNGGIPVWDKEEKKFVNSLNKEKVEETKDVNSGIESIKNKMQSTPTTSSVETNKVELDENDDLPF